MAALAYFTWKETGLTTDCASLDAMASRFEEAAALMRRLAAEASGWNARPMGPTSTTPILLCSRPTDS